ncbi:MAG: carbohydrate porin [Spirochaetia bacterium]|nr:carbohydrate porin [Spirochaetia bacterium]
MNNINKIFINKKNIWLIFIIFVFNFSVFSQERIIENKNLETNYLVQADPDNDVQKKYTYPEKRKVQKKRPAAEKKNKTSKPKKALKKYKKNQKTPQNKKKYKNYKYPQKRVYKKRTAPLKPAVPQKTDAIKNNISPQKPLQPLINDAANVNPENKEPDINSLPQNNSPEKNIVPENEKNSAVDKSQENSMPETNEVQNKNNTGDEKVTPEENKETEQDLTSKENNDTKQDTIPKENLNSDVKEVSDKVSDNYLTGGWFGARKAMVDKGVNFEIVYSAESDFNTIGGLSQGYVVLGNLDLTLDMDMEKLVGWSGGQIFVYGIGGHGQSPSALVGDLQATSNIETGMNYFKLYQFWLQQSLFNKKISLLLGLHDLNSEFYANDPAGLFFNSSFGIGADMSQTGDNGPSIFPSTSVAARLKVEPVDGFYIDFGGYNAVAGNPSKPWSSIYDFTFYGGFLLIGEIGYYVENNIKIAAGSWFYTKPVTDLSNANNTGYGIYLLFDKSIGENFSLFVRAGMANPLVYQIGYNIAEGIHLSGKIWARDDDEFGIGATTVIHTKAFQDLMSTAGTPTDIQETAIELTYKIQATPWVSLQPDFQYVVNPGTDPGVADAFVIALRSQISF